MSETTAQQPGTDTAADLVPVTFRVTTYWKRRRDEAGLTQASSERLFASQALDWVLNALPADAVLVDSDENGCTVVIDWTKVPDEIRYGRRSG